MQGQASDIRIHAEEIARLSKRLNKIYAKHTGQSEELIGMYSEEVVCKSSYWTLIAWTAYIIWSACALTDGKAFCRILLGPRTKNHINAVLQRKHWTGTDFNLLMKLSNLG